jgi:hypothetical protein
MFASPTSAKLQEIGPRFTLKLRWLRKGLPSVTAPDGRIAHGGDPEDDAREEAEAARQEKADEDIAMGELGKPQPVVPQASSVVIPPLDEEQEYEWKWKVSGIAGVVMAGLALIYSQRWKSQEGHSSCEGQSCIWLPCTPACDR